MNKTGEQILASLVWSGRLDLNQRPPEPHSGALPVCATPRTPLDYSAVEAESQTSRQICEAKKPSAAPKGSAPPPHISTAGKRTASHCCHGASGVSWPVNKPMMIVNTPPSIMASMARTSAPYIDQRKRRAGDGFISTPVNSLLSK